MRALLMSLLFLGATASAAPLTIDHQGRALDAAGSPLQGSLSFNFALYGVASGGSALWSESVDLAVQDGFYGWTLGSMTPLTPDLFDADERWLEVSIDGDSLGRKPLTSTPYALQAGVAQSVGDLDASSVQARVTGTCPAGQSMNGINSDGTVSCVSLYPTGLIGYFAEGCPAGFSLFAAGAGRTIVGTNGGAVGATVGSALANLGTRSISQVPAHAHTADPGSVSTSTAGSHGHTGSTNNTGNHDHSGTTASAGIHDHRIWTTVHDVGNSTSQGYPNGNNHQALRTTDRRGFTVDNDIIAGSGSHAHGFTTSSAGSHGHAVVVSPAGDHGHAVDLPQFSTSTVGSGAVDVTMPYIQLTACIAQ